MILKIDADTHHFGEINERLKDFFIAILLKAVPSVFSF